MKKKSAKKTPKKVVQNQKVEEPKFSLTLTIGGKEYVGTGLTALEALKSMPKPAKIFNKGVLVIQHGQATRQRPLTIVQAKRLFFPLAQRILAKQLEFGL